MTHLKAILAEHSKGHYGREKAIEIRDAARASIESRMAAKSMESKHTIRLIRELDAEIEKIENEISAIINELRSPITTIPGMGMRMGAMILAEVGDFSCFDSPDQVLAYLGMSPSTYQSGQLNNCYAHMEKRGSKYLRYAILMQQSTCVFGTQFSQHISQRREQWENITMLLYLTLPRSLCDLSLPWRNPAHPTMLPHNCLLSLI